MKQNEDECYYFEYVATLRIFGDIPDFDEISAKLNMEPTHTHRKGSNPRAPSMPYPHDMWSYTVPVPKSEPLDKHIDALWFQISDNKDYLLELKKSLHVSVFLGYRSDCETAGVEVPHTSLVMFTELEIPFELSIIVV